MKTVRQVASDMIGRWEGSLSMRPTDTGNYVLRNGKKVLVGSKYGVTGNALALHRNVPAANITAQDIASVTMDEAVDIALLEFYNGYRLNSLPWGRLAAIMMDFTWASGSHAITVLQGVLGVTKDGILGNNTRTQFVRELTDYSEKGFANKLLDARITFIKGLSDYIEYGNGWTNRITSFRPETPWWNNFDA